MKTPTTFLRGLAAEFQIGAYSVRRQIGRGLLKLYVRECVKPAEG
jgi:hypothetical protein